jgi:transaldolase
MRDGDARQRQFDDAGFGDVFHAPSSGEWAQIRRDKLPDLDADLTARLPLDTHFTLLAHADFEKNQEAIDAALERALAASR